MANLAMAKVVARSRRVELNPVNVGGAAEIEPVVTVFVRIRSGASSSVDPNFQLGHRYSAVGGSQIPKEGTLVHFIVCFAFGIAKTPTLTTDVWSSGFGMMARPARRSAVVKMERFCARRTNMHNAGNA